MAILSGFAEHTELNAVDGAKNPYTIFPINTSDDVLVDDIGNLLTDALPTVTRDWDARKGFLNVTEVKEDILVNQNLIHRITSDFDENFDDVRY